MLQLVQALRYEELTQTESFAKVQTGLKDFLIDKAVGAPAICHSLHWHVLLESENEDNDPEVRNFYKETYEDLMDTVK